MVLGAPRVRPFARDCGIVLSLLLSFTGNVRSQVWCSGGYRVAGSYPYQFCEPCPPGFYKSNNGNGYQLYCDACPPGKNAQNAYSTTCSDCLQHQYSTGASQFCTACSANSGNLAQGSSSCSCNAGYTGPNLGTCSACVAGKYKATTGTATCTDCEAGKFSAQAGTAACATCQAGTYSNNASITCIDCSVGKNSAAGAGRCTLSCAAGKYSNGVNLNFPSGIQTSYTPAADFYTKCQVCYDASYSSVTTIQLIDTCKSQANEEGWIMMGSKKGTATDFHKAAFIKESNFVTSSSLTAPYVSNGVYWYYVQSKSVGFTSETVLNLNPHDTDTAVMGTSISVCQSTQCSIWSNMADQMGLSVNSLLDQNTGNLWYSGHWGSGHVIQLDLQTTYYVETVRLYPFSASNYFANWDLLVGVSESTMETVYYNQPQVNYAPLPMTINRVARYIRIVVNAHNYFAANEIQIYGRTYNACPQANKLSWNLDNSGGMRSGCETNLQSDTLWRKMLYTCQNPVCTSCPAGKSSPVGSDALEDCVEPACPAGSTGPDGGTCTACVAGKFKTVTGSATCTDCGADTYSTTTGAMAADTCMACPADTQAETGSDAATDCVCVAGYTGPDGGTCTACVAGKYKTDPGSAGCTDCLANSYHALTGRTAASACQCNAGTRVGVACACPLCLPALLCFVLPCPAGNPIGLFQTPGRA